MSDHDTTAESAAEAALLEVAERFAIVPEWLLDADVSDAAIRLYAVLLRYGQSSGARMPGRATLARRLRKKSVDTIDRALRELVAAGAVTVEHRYSGGRRLTNRYHLHTRQPGDARDDSAGGRTGAATRDMDGRAELELDGCDGRTRAATPDDSGHAGLEFERGDGRTDAAGVAAKMRHNPKHFTQSTTTSPQPPDPATTAAEASRWRAEEDRFLENLGITDADAYTAEVAGLRRDAGGASARWARPSLVAALQAAVKARGWPAHLAAAALRIVAADPNTRSPMRLAEAGPWWDDAATARPTTSRQATANEASADLAPLHQIEAELTEADGLRVHLQAKAREQLRAEGAPVTRATVLRRAHALMLERSVDEVAVC